MNKKRLAVVLALCLCVLTAACGQKPDAVIADATTAPAVATDAPKTEAPTVPPTATTAAATTAAASATPAETTAAAATTAAASATPASTQKAVVEPKLTSKGQDNPDEVVNTGNLKDFAKQSTIIVVGKFTKFRGDMNACRDNNDPKKVSKSKIMAKEYTFKVEKCIKGNVKTGDIDFYTPYETQMTWQKAPWPIDNFIEPKVDQTYVLSLQKDRVIGHFIPADVDPYMFRVENDKMIVESKFSKTVKAFPDAIPLTELDKYKK